MSWLDKTNSDMVITTGEGSRFTPNWMNATRSVEFNITEFEFSEVDGTLVKRRRPKGNRFNLEIFFQGEDHLDQAEAFRIAANDPRNWVIYHPLYGIINVQPLSLNFDNTKYNVSEIKGVVVETILADNPQGTYEPADKIAEDKITLDEVTAENFAVEVPAPDATVKNVMKANVLNGYLLGVKNITSSIDSEQYFNLFNKANSAVLQATSNPLAAIRATQEVINYPFKFVGSVQTRVTTLQNQFNALSATVGTLFGSGEKKVYENNGTTNLSAMAIASITNPDYKNRTEVIKVMDIITDSYNQFLADLDQLQTSNGGSPDSYVPNPDSLIGLSNIISFTIPNLFAIALESKQERSVYCEDDTNVILLTHRFYGLLADDSTLNQLIETNQLGMNSLLQIRKGTRILYYV